jgi:hypothetical protein
MKKKDFNQLLESVKEMDNMIMDARELRYRFLKLTEREYSSAFILRELLLYMNQNQLQEFWDEFNRLYPKSFYDEDGNEL